MTGDATLSHGALRQGPAEWALLFTLVVLWGSSFMLVRVSLDAFTPLAVTAGRLLIGAGVLGLVLVAMRRRVSQQPRHWLFFLAMAPGDRWPSPRGSPES